MESGGDSSQRETDLGTSTSVSGNSNWSNGGWGSSSWGNWSLSLRSNGGWGSSWSNSWGTGWGNGDWNPSGDGDHSRRWDHSDNWLAGGVADVWADGHSGVADSRGNVTWSGNNLGGFGDWAHSVVDGFLTVDGSLGLDVRSWDGLFVTLVVSTAGDGDDSGFWAVSGVHSGDTVNSLGGDGWLNWNRSNTALVVFTGGDDFGGGVDVSRSDSWDSRARKVRSKNNRELNWSTWDSSTFLFLSESNEVIDWSSLLDLNLLQQSSSDSFSRVRIVSVQVNLEQSSSSSLEQEVGWDFNNSASVQDVSEVLDGIHSSIVESSIVVFSADKVESNW